MLILGYFLVGIIVSILFYKTDTKVAYYPLNSYDDTTVGTAVVFIIAIWPAILVFLIWHYLVILIGMLYRKF